MKKDLQEKLDALQRRRTSSETPQPAAECPPDFEVFPFKGTPAQFATMAQSEGFVVVDGAREPVPKGAYFPIGRLRPDANPVTVSYQENDSTGAVHQLLAKARSLPDGESHLLVRMDLPTQGIKTKWDMLYARMEREGWLGAQPAAGGAVPGDGPGTGKSIKSKSGRRGYGTKAEKRQAVHDWDTIPPDERPRLEDWLENQFGTESGLLNVKPRTFQGWRRYLNSH